MEPAVEVRLHEASYPIFIGARILNNLGEVLKGAVSPRRTIIFTNPTVEKLWGAATRLSLEKAGIASDLLEVPDGEEFKNLEVAFSLYEKLVSLNVHRNDPVIALGGGVIGDLAGFVAATYMRGLPLIQVPTTLLAQVDSSVGGKVAVNLPQGKNLVGCFYQPRLVLIDVSLLRSLPEREFKSGLAEVTKYGFIRDAAFLAFVEDEVGKIVDRDEQALESIITRSCGIKAEFVELDEKDHGIRGHLNYGHTIGHALEAAGEYRGYLHGEAVAIGMVGAALVSHYSGLLERSEAERHEALITRLGLPTRIADIRVGKIKEQMEIDKKFTGETNRWVLLKQTGEATMVERVPQEIIDRVLLELGATE